ncbi:MAG TPA: amino acid adenylation domain-containing protein [Rhodanobacteraceae bacterium]|nr:amino acid adenylation domain-containing protein [Rhodanobacteraceae bacterium]
MHEVIDAYELSPMQEGMLFHAMSERGRGIDIEQIVITLHEAFDLQRFRQAWHRLMQRHTILRTRFRWEDVERPRQEVVADVELPVTQADWRELPAAVAEQRFAAQLTVDRHADFDLSCAPLMRLFVTQFAADHWRVLWTFHHALLDGRSFAVVLRELFALYDASRGGTDATLPAPTPYRAYIEWRRALDLTAAEAFWKQSLRDFHASTPFAIDLPRLEGGAVAADGEEPFAAHQRRLSRQLTARLRAAARRADVTLNTLLQAGWAVLLHRYSGESDIVFGATRAGRNTGFQDADNMVGLFINTLPLRASVDEDAAIVPWLQSLRAQQVALRPYEHTPLANVQAWSAVARGAPLFESVIVYDHLGLDAQLQGESWSGRQFEYVGQTNFPLTVIGYGDDEMLLRLEYSRRRFSDAAAGRMLNHLIVLLTGLADGRAERIRDLDLLTGPERAQLTAGNPIAQSAGAHRSVHQRFEEQVTRTPEAIAVVFDTDEGRIELSYAELDRRANALAQHLRRLGVIANQLVGLHTERNADLVVAILGVLKAGGAYLPLDPVYPAARIAFMLRDADVRIVLTQRALVAGLAGLPVTCLCLDEPLPPATAIATAVPSAPQDLAYVIYTSGSTGQPKGVRVTHHNVLRLFAATDSWFDFRPQDVWTLFHSYAFDFSVWELWGALLHGGRVVVVSQELSRHPEAFRELLLCEGVTVLNQTPTAFRQLIEIDRASPRGDFALRLVIFGGEALELQNLAPWLDRYGEHAPRLINMYGITETTVHVTYRPIGLEDLENHAGSIIGVPIPDLRVYLLDPRGQPVPVGVPGEMHIAGEGVAAGYLNRPELTDQRFLPDPFQPAGSSVPPRMYRSGDLARRLENGELEYLGRIDQQVKIRGFRIELGEIEAVLAQHPKLHQVAVIDREDIPNEKRLAAYLVADPPHASLLDELRETLRQRLPDYMVPSHFLFLDALPLTPNGKLDRRALPAPESSRTVSGKPFSAPRNTTEQTIAEIWKAVLHLDRVGIDDHFFELGGDSILSIQIIARCRQQGLRLTPRDLFRHPTVAQLAQVITAVPAARPRSAETVSGSVPLTPIQSWFFEQRFARTHHWNQAFMFAVAADFDPDSLERAFQFVLTQHDALRLHYTRRSGGWTQQYGEAAPITVQRVDLSPVPVAGQAAAITQHATRVQEQMDLAICPLLRVVHFNLGSASAGRLLLVVHHLIVDGISWRILREDLESAYLAITMGATPQFAEKTCSLRIWAERSGAFAQTAEIQASLAHWRTVSAIPATELPADAPANEPSPTEPVVVRLSDTQTRSLLQQLPRVFRTQINDVLLSALARALQKNIGGTCFRIDLEGHGREHIADDIDVSRTMGWFTTLFPVALEIPADGDATGCLLAIRDQLRQLPHRGMSYGLLRYASDDASVRDLLANATPSTVVFNYLGQFDTVVADSRVFAFAAESTGPWRSPDARRTHALEIIGIVRAGCLEIEWHYDAGVHRQATIAHAANDMIAALQEILAVAADTPVIGFTPADFPLAALDQAALTRLMSRHPQTEDIYPLTPMQRLFFAMERSDGGLGFEQWQFRIDGILDSRRLRRAFEYAVQRHSILRTAFVDNGGAQPLQIVARTATLPWVDEDLRSLTVEERSSRVASLLRSDAQRGFDLALPPAMRVTLFRVGEHSWHLIWSTHHLCIDGWSWPVLFRDVSRAYAAFEAGDGDPGIEAAIPFRDYVEWLADSAPRSEQFWRDQLRDFAAPTPIRLGPATATPAAPADRPGEPFAETTLAIAADVTAALRELARREHVTPSVVMNAAWALLLAHYGATDDVTFGASFSGRPAEVRGIESLVGPCVNNLPVRVAVPAEQPLGTWLAQLQNAQFELAQHQYTSLERIQQWAQVAWRYRLFDSLIVFQNYQVDIDARSVGANARLALLEAPEATNYPLTIAVSMAEELRIRFIHRPSMLEAADVRQFASDLETLLHAMARSTTADVRDLIALLPPELRGRAKTSNAAKATSRGTDYSAPTNEAERVIAGVWQRLFDVDRISLDDNFFELGGHSLLLVRAHAELKETLRADLPIVALLQYPTARSLARYLTDGRADAPTSEGAMDRARRQREAYARQRNLAGKR